ncbi:MAG: hypothetical protein ABSG90_14735, partial [Dehalococcoidia bacterium]
TVNQQFANLIAEQAIITPSTQAVKSAATTINPTVMQSTTPLRVNVINPDAVPYSSSAGVGGAGVPQGNTPATILSTGLAQTMGVPVGTVVPSGTTITPSTGKVVMPAITSAKSSTIISAAATPSVITTPVSTPATPAARPLAPAVPSTPGFSDGTQVLVTYTNGSTAIMTNAQVQAMAAEGGLAAFSITGWTPIPKGQSLPSTHGATITTNPAPVSTTTPTVDSSAGGKAWAAWLASLTPQQQAIFNNTSYFNVWMTVYSPTLGSSNAIQSMYNLYAQFTGAQLQSDITSGVVGVTVDNKGNVTTKLSDGTINTGKAGAGSSGVIMTVAPPVPKSVDISSSLPYYIFTNLTTKQTYNVYASDYDSWSAQKQFAYLKSIGALSPDKNINDNAVLSLNADGTWGYSIPSGAVYSSIPAWDSKLINYLKLYDKDVYNYFLQNGSLATMNYTDKNGNRYADIVTGAINVLNAQGISTSGSPGLSVGGIQPQLGLQTTINNMPQDLQNAYYQVMNKGGNQQAALTAIQTSAQQVITTFAQNQNVKITSASSLTQQDVNSLVAAGINTAYLAATGVTNTMINNAVAAYNQATLNSFLAQLSTEPQVLQNAYNSAAKAGGVTAGLLAYELALTSMKEAYSGIVTQLNSYYQKTNQVSISPNATNINPLDAMAAGVTQAQWLAAGLDAVEPYAMLLSLTLKLRMPIIN